MSENDEGAAATSLLKHNNRGKPHIKVGSRAILMDLCKLRMGFGPKVVEKIEEQKDDNNLFYGYALGFNDFAIARRIESMDRVHNRSDIDKIDQFINSHHRFFIFSFMRQTSPEDSYDLLFGDDVFKSPKILSMILLNPNFKDLRDILYKKKNYGFIETEIDCMGRLLRLLKEEKKKNNIDRYGIGGTLGVHSLALFLGSEKLDKILDISFKIRELQIGDTLLPPEEIVKNMKYQELKQNPIFLSSYTVPCVRHDLDANSLSPDDTISVELRMTARPGASLGYASDLRKALGVPFFAATGKYDYIARFEKVIFRDYYNLILNFLETEGEEAEFYRRGIRATESSLFLPLPPPGSARYKKDHIPNDEFDENGNDKRDPRPGLLKPDTDDPERISTYHILNKAASISYFALYDIDRFAYTDIIPFLRRGWMQSISVTTYDNIKRKIESYKDVLIKKSQEPLIPKKEFEKNILDHVLDEIISELEEISGPEDTYQASNQIRNDVLAVVERAVEIRESGDGKEEEVYSLDKAVIALEMEQKDTSRLYLETVNSLQIARLQRYWGTRTSFHNYILNPANFESGIQLLIHGLGSIVFGVFNYLNTLDRARLLGHHLSWTGFFNVDPNPKNIQVIRRLRVICLPLRELLSIKDIIAGLTHEAAHTILFATGLQRYINEYLLGVNFLTRNPIIETLCDIMIFTFGFRGSLEKHFAWVPGVISRDRLALVDLEEAMSRIFGVFLFKRFYDNFLSGNDKNIGDEVLFANKIEGLFEEFTDEIKTMISGKDRESYKDLETLYSEFKKVTSPDSNTPEYPEPKKRVIDTGKKLIEVLIILKANVLISGNDEEAKAPLFEVLGHRLINEYPFKYTDELKKVADDSNLSKWTEFLKNLDDEEFKLYQYHLPNEFIFSLTDLLRSDKKTKPGIEHCGFAVLASFDLSMRSQDWKNHTRMLLLREEWI